MDQIFKWVDIKNKLSLTKIGFPKWGIFSWGGFPKFKHFNLLHWMHEIFKVSECKRKIKFETI